jgi:hypothetical protein
VEGPHAASPSIAAPSASLFMISLMGSVAPDAKLGLCDLSVPRGVFRRTLGRP